MKLETAPSVLPKIYCLLVLMLGHFYMMAQPNLKSEFRGVWLATVDNIDWPPKDSYDLKLQKQSFEQILDFYQDMNFNSIIVQVRTTCDALYFSDSIPVSRFLTGEEGEKGAWKQDPLEYMIRETHKRGLDFHAWLNPYRVTIDSNTNVLSKHNVYYEHPDWIIKYGNQYYLDPGLPQVQDHFDNVVYELVSKYNVDGIHFDDYFYPYKVDGEQFDDSISFSKYGLGFSDIEDWRRANVDSLVKNVSKTIDQLKPWVRFGISPFGVWRNASKDPKGSETAALQTNYDDLYADPLYWMENDWVDYIAPQLYWSLDYEKASFRTLLNWWSSKSENTEMYVGIGAYKFEKNSDRAWWRVEEIPDQLSLLNSTQNTDGYVFFSAKSLMNKPKLSNVLKSKELSNPALPYIDDEISREQVQLTIKKVKTKGNFLVVKVDANQAAKSVLCYAMNEQADAKLLDHVRGGNLRLELELTELKPGDKIGFSFLDKYNRLGSIHKAYILEKRKEKWILK